MANIVVTSTTNSILVDFGDYAGTDMPTVGIIPNHRTYQKHNIEFRTVGGVVQALLLHDGKEFPVSYDGATGTLQIDEVNSSAPSSDSDLYTKLIALIA